MEFYFFSFIQKECHFHWQNKPQNMLKDMALDVKELFCYNMCNFQSAAH